MSRIERQATSDLPAVRPRRQVIPPRYLDDFYVDYTMPCQPLHSDEQPTNGATGPEPGKRPVFKEFPCTESGPEPTKSMSTGSNERSSFVETYQGLPQPLPQPKPRTRTSPRRIIDADQRVLSSSPHTVATENRPVLLRDQDYLPQPMRALPVDSQRDLLHSVSHKEIDYLTDNLGELRLPGSANLLTTNHPFSPYEPTQAQHKLTNQ